MRRRDSWLLEAALFGTLLAIVAFTYGGVVGTRPFEGDNLYILQWADSAEVRDLLRSDPDVYPEWRPLAYATVWAQYKWAAIDHIWSYYLVNALLWTACGWFVCRIVRIQSGSVSSGLVAGAILLSSPRLISSFVLIVDRQSSLACFFGLLAWLIIARNDSGLTRLGWLGMSFLLLASALSKEYGLAFAGAVAVHAMRYRRPDLATAAACGIVFYAALRVWFAAGALAGYCEDQGFFFGQRAVCISHLDGSTIVQAVYNVVATGLGSFLPGLFTNDGQILVAPRRLLMSMGLLCIAAVGWMKGPESVRLALPILVSNAVLSFMLYRSRNHVVALCAMSVAVGVGLPMVGARLKAIVPRPLNRALVVGVVLSLLSARALTTREYVMARVEDSSQPNTCAEGVPTPDREFMRRLWQRYQIELEECTSQ